MRPLERIVPGITIAIQTVSTVVLARLLTPADVGLYALTLILAGFAATDSHLGLGSALIQRRDPAATHLSTAFWMNEAIGLAPTVALALCGRSSLLPSTNRN